MEQQPTEQQESRFASFLAEPEKRKKAIAVGLATLFVILVLIVILILSLTLGSRENCQLSEQRPWAKGKTAIASQNQLALVRFAGHLRIWQTDDYDKDSKYLDLNLEQVRYFFGANGYSHLALDADCSKVEIEFSRDEKLKIFRVKRITIQPKTGHAHFKECHVYPDDIFFAYEQYWSCSQTRTYYCEDLPTESSSSPRQVAIAFDQLEIELDGDPDEIAHHRFDKLKVECP